MISILGGGNYTFPEKQPLTLRLKDMLDDVVEDKYYIILDDTQGFDGVRLYKDYSPTLRAGRSGLKVALGIAQRGREHGQQFELNGGEFANALTTVQKDSMVYNGYQIRKLTPKECWRLMGFTDEQFDKVSFQSNTQLYKQAGNSIVVPVLESLFKELI
jgi:DNA (cytosine-5)-methyltransferase 1